MIEVLVMLNQATLQSEWCSRIWHLSPRAGNKPLNYCNFFNGKASIFYLNAENHILNTFSKTSTANFFASDGPPGFTLLSYLPVNHFSYHSKVKTCWPIGCREISGSRLSLCIYYRVPSVPLSIICVCIDKNPAYGRQSISRPMQIVAPIPQ